MTFARFLSYRAISPFATPELTNFEARIDSARQARLGPLRLRWADVVVQ